MPFRFLVMSGMTRMPDARQGMTICEHKLFSGIALNWHIGVAICDNSAPPTEYVYAHPRVLIFHIRKPVGEFSAMSSQNSSATSSASDTQNPASPNATEAPNPAPPDTQGSATAEPDRICSICFLSLPAWVFRFRNRATGVRMKQCRVCHAATSRARDQKKRTRDAGWQIQKTASRIARSPNLTQTTALLHHLIEAMGGVQNLVDRWRAECIRLSQQRRSSTRLPRMYEMLIVLMGQVRRMCRWQ